MININNYIWIFGENRGLTANNNPYYLWKQTVNLDDNIDKYFVVEKNRDTLKIYNTLSKNEKKHILWKNSYKHYKKFLNADLFLVSWNYTDITPDKLLFKTMSMRLKKPVVNLQNGICGIKKIKDTGPAYDNNIIRYLVYNNNLINHLIECNDFKDYQLYRSDYPAKYGELLQKQDESTNNQILWFIDYRRYFKTDDLHIKTFSSLIRRIVNDNELKKYLKENNLTLKICTHVLFEDKVFNEFSKYSSEELINVLKQSEVNLQEEIANSRLLITDYSDIIYDFSFLNKSYILFQPDLKMYLTQESLYDDLNGFAVDKPSQLIDKIINEDFEKYEFIENVFEDKDFELVKQNRHITSLYDYLSALIKNKITFIGYNFYGIGGTVNATMALSEALLRQGYLVDCISLKRTDEIRHVPPYGLNMQYLSWAGSGSVKEKIQNKIRRNPKYYSHLAFDYSKKFLPPYAGYKLDKLMKTIKTKTLVSTRESLHLFLNDCESEFVENRVYFFHTIAGVIENNFPKLMDNLKDCEIDNAVFITEQNRLAIKDEFNYSNYKKYIDLGNTLIKSKIIDKNQIEAIDKKDRYCAIYLLRISESRKKDIDNLIEFGKYVKINGITNITVDVYGDGDYVDKFMDLIESDDLSDVIHYKMSSQTPILEIRNHDFMIDFSLNHSFGMTYIEAILNGKKVFCMENPGSLEVMEGIDNSYIESYQWLCSQIDSIDKISTDELKRNYDTIYQKYSPESIADKFIDFIGGDYHE